MRPRIRDVGRLFGLELPRVGQRGYCPLRDHKRQDKPFSVYVSKNSSDELYKCHSCDGDEASGDAVRLYALLAHIDEGEALGRLREIQFQVGREDQRSQGPAQPRRVQGPPLAGTPPRVPLDLDPGLVEKLRDDPAGQALVEKFVARRKLDPEVGKRFLVGMPKAFHGGAVGFVYTDPRTGRVCRLKVRGLEEKAFRVVPKGDSATGERALAPLFLAHLLEPKLPLAIVTEGEVDALSLLGLGLPNVISLPDGASSVKTTDLSPLYVYSTWVLSFDDDKAGREAAGYMRERARRYGADCVWVRWPKSLDDVTGEVLFHKDANDAVMNGLDRTSAERLIDDALRVRYGVSIAWRRQAA